MDTSTAVMMVAALVTLAAVYWKSPAAASSGLSATGALILEIIPRMVAAFTLAGLIQAIVPQEMIVKWMGHGSGMRGILIGMTLGSLTPGGPMTHFPIIRLSSRSGLESALWFLILPHGLFSDYSASLCGRFRFWGPKSWRSDLPRVFSFHLWPAGSARSFGENSRSNPP
jgi:hypothetical protein